MFQRLRLCSRQGFMSLAWVCLASLPAFADDWPAWRGVEGNNHSAAGAEAPLKWNLQSGDNIAWKTPIPGRGHSTPVVVDDGIFLTTAQADAQTQSLIKFDRQSGRMIDQWVLHRGTLPANIHGNNSYASPTPAFDGEHLFVSFHTNDAIWLTKITTSGRVVWQNRVAAFEPKLFQFGYGASPIVENGLVIVAAEYDGPDSGLYALDARTGKPVWKVARPSNLNFASPIAATIVGQRQILLAGAEMFASYDPNTGKVIWSVDSTTEAICGTAVWDGRRVMVSGGNPASGTWCISGDGSNTELWSNRVKCYEQSLLAITNYVFAIADNGVAYCWRTEDGKEMWKERLFGGGISSSPTLVGDHLYIATEAGQVFVIKASPNRFEPIAENPTGDSIFATPVPVDGRLYLRTGVGAGANRQEYLVAVGRVSPN
ncbi:outer membrane biogenesis protein BamB [Rubripirellula tenax]|uniref:Outer membrane biogenesis protein BamB n=1 Tax=Rubripirellula tenax TaxID=2528015 RepID=A0A5C6F596_9BACT|nr:PQQ-binding-like beta-propeller repeat protein [Rubripirellula tenax]TWU56933.1 outer membrane biogenesis protein BamB [Rubripirellula tenax]